MSTRIGTGPDKQQYPPEILPFLPLLYVVWQDGVLTDSELRSLQRRIDHDGGLSPANAASLKEYLDPENPPTVARLHEWRRIAEDAVLTDGRIDSSLAEVGARVTDSGVGSSVHAGVAAVEGETGIVGREAVRAIAAGPIQSQVTVRQIESVVDVAALTKYLYGSHLDLRNEVFGMLEAAAFQDAPEHNRTAYREWVFDRIVDLAKAGYGSMAFPLDCGGRDDMRGFITVFEAVACRDLSIVIKFGVQFGLFGGSIHQLGSPEQRAEYLPSIGSAVLPGCFAMTETGHGSNVRDIATTATFDRAKDSFVIDTPSRSAWKDYIGNAATHGRVATVFAQLVVDDESMGVHAFVVPIRGKTGQPVTGVSIEDCGHKMGLNGVDNGRLCFSGVVIPRTNLLSRFGEVGADGSYTSDIASDGKRFFTMLATLVGGRVSVGIGALSAAKSGLAIAIRYGDIRRQFGPKGQGETRILDYRTHQRRLLPRLAKAYALHFALHNLADRYVAAASDSDRQEIEVLAAGLKAYSTHFTTVTLQEARECCGGQGFLWENRIAALKADTDVFTTFEGDNTVLFLQVAKGLIGEYGHQFSNMDVFGYVKHFARLAALSAIERNPIVARQTDSDHLRDPHTLEAALRYRSDTLLRSVARRLKHRIDKGMDSFDAFVECQDHLVELAEAHTELKILEAFRERISEAPSHIAESLRPLLELFGLASIEENRGWYLEQNYIEATKSRAIRAEVNALLLEIRPNAVSLVTAFGISDNLLGAPILREA